MDTHKNKCCLDCKKGAFGQNVACQRRISKENDLQKNDVQVNVEFKRMTL
jgi:hypothetical protein